MGVIELVSELQALKAKIKGVLTGHIVTTITYCATKWTATCSPMIGQIFDAMIVASTDIDWLSPIEI